MKKNTISFLALAVSLNFSGLSLPAYGVGEEGDDSSSKSPISGSSNSSSSASAQSQSQVQKFKSFFPRIKEDQAQSLNAEFQALLKDYDTWSEDEKDKYTPDLKNLFKMTPSKTILDYLRRLMANIKESLDNTGKSTNRFPDLDLGQIARLTKRVDSLSFLDTPDAQVTPRYGEIIVKSILADLTDPLNPNISEANNLLESAEIYDYNDALLVSGQEDLLKTYRNQKIPKNLGDDVDDELAVFFTSHEFSQFIRNHIARISPLEVPDFCGSASYETLVQNFLSNRYVMGVSQISAHGTQLYPFATFIHDKFHRKISGFSEKVFLKYIHSNVGILWKKNPITALDIFTKDVLPWLVDMRPALFDFFRGLHGAMSAEHQPDSLEYKTYIAGHFLLTHELGRWSEEVYQQYDTASLVKFLMNIGLTQSNSEETLEKRDPFKTSPVTGKTSMTVAEIEKYILENQGDFQRLRNWYSNPLLPKEVTKVKESPLITAITLRYKVTWEQIEARVPTLRYAMKNSEDSAYMWKYLGMSLIASPDFSVITDATQQRQVAYDYLKEHTKREQDLFKAWGKIVSDVLTTEKGRQIAESFDKFARDYKAKLEKAGLLQVPQEQEHPEVADKM